MQCPAISDTPNNVKWNGTCSTNNQTVGTVCEATCEGCYSIVGVSTVTCDYSKRWSPLPSNVKCQGYCNLLIFLINLIVM